MSEVDASTVGWFNEALDHAVLGLDRERRLRPDQVAQLRDLVHKLERYSATAQVRVDAPSHRLKWIVSGWASEMHVLPDTRRQICSFFLPGDVFAAPAPSSESICEVVALTRLDCLDVKTLLSPLGETEPYEDLIARRLRDNSDRRYEHLMRLGQLTAPERLAHLLLEIHDRLSAVNLADETYFRLPLTQEHLADALGLSVVHVNRSLRMLRANRLLEVRFGGVTLLDRRQLWTLAGRDPQSR